MASFAGKELFSSVHFWVQEDSAVPFVRMIALLVRQEGALVAEYMNDFKVNALKIDTEESDLAEVVFNAHALALAVLNALNGES